VIRELAGHIPEEVRNSKAVRELTAYGCLTRMHVVRLLAPRLDNETLAKDVDFSPGGIRQRWDAGYANTRRAIALAPWNGDFDDLEGVILHEPADATPVDSMGKGVMVTAQGGHRAGARDAPIPTMTQARGIRRSA
jgi:NTE family protein